MTTKKSPLCHYYNQMLRLQATSSNFTNQRHSHTNIKNLIKYIALAIALCLLGSSPLGCNSQCTETTGCFPPVGNLAIGRTVTTESTCTMGSEYCIFLQPDDDCLTCSPNTTNDPTNINDNDESTVWVSQIGPSSAPSVLQFDFESEFLFESTSIVFDSVRPRAMVLEYSRDEGATWEVYRYYSTRCVETFGLNDMFVDEDTVFDTLDPICTSIESLFFPFTGGTVKFSTSQHLSPNISETTATRYRTLTNIRIQLLGYFEELELNGNRFVYFSISEWYVKGQCMCHGHSGVCVPQPGEESVDSKVYSGCDCEHNTAGNKCEMCATGFNNRPWRAGTATNTNPCQGCICNEHAEDCQFIAAHSTSECINCSDNTAGDNCQACQPGYFQDLALLLNDPVICRNCECSAQGAVNDVCDSQGQCSCKSNVDSDSLKCTQCLDGYWNLTQNNDDGCEICDCVVEGTVISGDLPLCDKLTGDCMCTESAQGRQCNQCKAGFYDLSSGCLPCNCNLGGSEIPVCDQNSPVAQCPCKPNVESILCNTPLPGYFFKPLDSIVFEAEEATFPDQTSTFFPLDGDVLPFTGRGFTRPAVFSDISFQLYVPERTQYEVIIRYQTMEPVEGLTVTLYSKNGVTLDLDCDETSTPTNVTRFQVAALQSNELFYRAFSVCLDSSVEYQLLLEYTTFFPVEWLFDSIVLLPEFSEISAYYQSRSPEDQVNIIEQCLPRAITTQLDPLCEEPSFSLSTEFFGQVFQCDCDPVGTINNITCLAFGGSCAACHPGVTGARCDNCMNGWFNFTAGGCQECGCDGQGASSPVCNQVSGQCDCFPGATTRTCGECLPGFFNLTSSGCSPCQCSDFALSQQCDSTGQCLCPDGVEGLKCNVCLSEFYNISTEGCLQCQCDPLGSESTQCDVATGQCVCTGNSVGLNCNECTDGSFLTKGVILDRCVQCVCTGKTDECVVNEINFILGSIQTDFTTLCATAPTECASGWRLLTENGQPAAPFGPSDASGLGYILLLNDQPMIFAPDSFLVNRLGSYGQMFNMVVRVEDGLLGPGTLLINSTIIRMVGGVTGEVVVGVFPPPTIQDDTFSRLLYYSIPIMEEYWHVGSRDGPNPNQLQFLAILADVGQLSTSAGFTEDLIEFVHVVNVSLISTFSTTELAVADVVVNTRSYPVEECLCPDGFSGSSCQNCDNGYFRPSGDIRDTCVRCECNNQSLNCDMFGVCLNCTGNSEGSNCEQCVSGYYGDPTKGIPCSRCSCPLVDNSFSVTCFLDIDNQQTCDACQLGYIGRTCEMCGDGYFGNPLVGFCNDCQCNGNVDLALGPVCDTTTGRCMNCQNNTTGFNCGICRSGYFGDPTLQGQSCQVCPCDPRGTTGDCDSLFGKCFCEPNVIGQLCDQCADGYWGLSQGLGCIPCNCCNNGSVNATCNKDSGACDCLPNVGSFDDDEKCCTCSPGYYNFTSSAGCEECNCSTLATSNECDLVTGRCQCVDGAIGLKCNDCAFGFTGQVPDCIRCHECYFQWYDTITDMANRILDLRVRVDSFVTIYYNGHTLSTIQTELGTLTSVLENANTTINSMTLEESDVARLEASLAQVNETLNRYTMDIIDIQTALNMSEINLDRANEFDGTVNMSDVTELQELIHDYNASIHLIIATANDSFDMLVTVRGEIVITWEDLKNFEIIVQQLVLNVNVLELEAENIEADLMEVQTTYNLLRMNLTHLDTRANQLINQLTSLSITVNAVTFDLRSKNDRVSSLATHVEMKLDQINLSLVLSSQLNRTVRSAFSAVMDANEKARELLVQTESGIDQANSTLSSILSSIQTVSDIFATLAMSKNTSRGVLSVRGFPLEQAQQLAELINGTILPDEFVQEIIKNASNSHKTAVEALTIAENALSAISDTLTIVSNLRTDLYCSREQQLQVARNLTQLWENINVKGSDLQQVNEQSDSLSTIIEEIDQTRITTALSIESAEQLISDGHIELSDLSEQVQLIADDTAIHIQGVDDAAETYTQDLLSEIATAHNSASNSLTTVQSLYKQAQNSSTAAMNVPLQQIQDLLQMYVSESIELSSLSDRVNALQLRLATLTSSITSGANRLNNCYKTP